MLCGALFYIMEAQQYLKHLDGVDKDMALQLKGIGVDYGELTALDGVDLCVPRGEIFGLLGPNGAGKTSLFNVISTLMFPTRGDAWINGYDIQRETTKVRRLLTYMPDLSPMPSDLKVLEYLRFFAETYGFFGDERDARVSEILRKVDLLDQQKQFCDKLSLGQRQRLALGRALLHRPEILLLDEPASGLDPISRRRLREILQEAVWAGATVIISSHVTAEIEGLCTSVGLLVRGRLTMAGPISDVLGKIGSEVLRIEITIQGDACELADWLWSKQLSAQLPTVEKLNKLVVEVEPSKLSSNELFKAVASSPFEIMGFKELKPTVEDLFFEVPGEEKVDKL